jgi:ribosomal protein S12 methylthiotransferase accessory factor
VAAEPWADLVSPRVGVIRQLSPQHRAVEEPEPPHLWTARLSNFDFRVAEASERMAAGKGWTEAEAKAAAVGEAVERYCANHVDPRRTFVARASELTLPALTPVLYHETQYARPGWPHPRWDPDAPVTWVEGVRVPGGEPVALPATFVYLSVPRAEESFAPVTSNGLAAGSSLPGAVLGGLCELMERDALMIAWLNRLPAAELELAASGNLPAALVRHYAALGVGVRAFVLASDLPATTVLALSSEDRGDRPATIVGMGCHPSPAVALTKALFELCQARPAEAGRYRENSPVGRLTRYEDVRTLDDHSAFAALPERRGEFEFLWRDGATARLEALEDRSRGGAAADLEACASALASAGHELGYAELTTDDVAPTGYHVARVVATGLHPIHFGYGTERLGGERVFTLPARLGLAPSRVELGALNPCPHPMA